jgi:hypothetical protein
MTSLLTYAADVTERPTLIPSSWPEVADLCPVVVPRYPAAPNTDDRATWIPSAEVQS